MLNSSEDAELSAFYTDDGRVVSQDDHEQDQQGKENAEENAEENEQREDKNGPPNDGDKTTAVSENAGNSENGDGSKEEVRSQVQNSVSYC
jgi:TATA-binding protein-associated factor Taf7